MIKLRKIFLCVLIGGVSFSALAGRVLATNAPLTSNSANNANSGNNNSTNNTNNYAATNSTPLGMSFKQIVRAAERGDPDAQYALGYMYYYGQGTPKDDIAAKVWIEKSAAQGQPQAQKALNLINRTNYPDQGKVAAAQPIDTAPATGAVKMPNSVAAAQSANESDATAAATAATTDNSLAITSDETAGSTAVTSARIKATHKKLMQPSPKAQYSSSEKRLLKAPSHYYTLQLLGAFKKTDVIKVMNHYRLGSKAAYYKTFYEDKPWYVLVYGTYRNDHEAEAAIAKLPSGVRKLEPWVKSMSSVHAGIRKAESKSKSHG